MLFKYKNIQSKINIKMGLCLISIQIIFVYIENNLICKEVWLDCVFLISGDIIEVLPIVTKKLEKDYG